MIRPSKTIDRSLASSGKRMSAWEYGISDAERTKRNLQADALHKGAPASLGTKVFKKAAALSERESGGFRATVGRGGLPGSYEFENGRPRRFSEGGYVDEPGPKGIDSVDAKIAPGEYVLSAEVVEALGGPAVLDQMVAALQGKEPGGEMRPDGKVGLSGSGGVEDVAKRQKELDEAINTGNRNQVQDGRVTAQQQTQLEPQKPAGLSGQLPQTQEKPGFFHEIGRGAGGLVNAADTTATLARAGAGAVDYSIDVAKNKIADGYRAVRRKPTTGGLTDTQTAMNGGIDYNGLQAAMNGGRQQPQQQQPQQAVLSDRAQQMKRAMPHLSDSTLEYRAGMPPTMSMIRGTVPVQQNYDPAQGLYVDSNDPVTQAKLDQQTANHMYRNPTVAMLPTGDGGVQGQLVNPPSHNFASATALGLAEMKQKGLSDPAIGAKDRVVSGNKLLENYRESIGDDPEQLESVGKMQNLYEDLVSNNPNALNDSSQLAGMLADLHQQGAFMTDEQAQDLAEQQADGFFGTNEKKFSAAMSKLLAPREKLKQILSGYGYDQGIIDGMFSQ